MSSASPPAGARVRIAVFLLGTSALLNLYSTQPVLPQIARWAGVSEVAAAWSVSATTAGVALAAPFAGAVSDRVGRTAVMLAAIGAQAVATGLCALSASFVELLALRFAQGLGTPFVFTVAVAYLGEEFAAGTAARLNALYVAGTAFGGLAGRLLPALAARGTADWRVGFLPLVAVLVLVLVVAARWLPRERLVLPLAGRRSDGAGRLVDRRLAATCLVGAALLFQQVSSFTFVSLHLQRAPFGLDPLQVSAIFLVFLAPVATTPVVGRLTVRIGRARTFAIGSALGAVGLALSTVPVTGAVVAGLALSCVAVFAGQACATGSIAAGTHRRRSSAVGLYLTCYYLGGTIGGVAPAPVYAAGGWDGVVLLDLVVIAASVAIAAPAWRTSLRRAERVRRSDR